MLTSRSIGGLTRRGDVLPLMIWNKTKQAGILRVRPKLDCRYRSASLRLALQCSIFDPIRSQIFAEFFLHHRFVIGPVADVHLGDGVAFEDDEVGANAVQEQAVVTRDQCGVANSLRRCILRRIIGRGNDRGGEV